LDLLTTGFALSRSTQPRWLWLHGPAGAGKTALMDHVFHAGATTLSALVHLRPDHAARMSPALILNTLAYRLASRWPRFRDAMLDARARDGGIDDVADLATPTPRRLRKLIVDPLAVALEAEDAAVAPATAEGGRPPPVLIGLDGLDALTAPMRRDLLDAFRGEWGRVSPRLRLMMSSRDDVADDEIGGGAGVAAGAAGASGKKGGGALPITRCRLAGEDQDRDLEVYAAALLKSKLLGKGKAAEAGEDDGVKIAAEALRVKAGGRFLWMKLAFEPLTRGPGAVRVASNEQLEATVESFPVGLDAIFDGLLTSFHDGTTHGSGVAGEIASFRRCVAPFLLVKEPITVVSFAKLLDADVVEVRRALCRASCFLEVLKDGRVRVAHSSFTEFVFGAQEGSRSPSAFRCDRSTVEASLALRCLGHLVRGLRPNPLDLEDPVAWLNEEVPQLEQRIDAKVPDYVRYAARHWGTHLERMSLSIAADEGVAPTTSGPAPVVSSPSGGQPLARQAPATQVDPKLLKAVEDMTFMMCSEKLLEWLELLSLMSSIDTVAFPTFRAVSIYLESIKAVTALGSVMGFFQRNLSALSLTKQPSQQSDADTSSTTSQQAMAEPLIPTFMSHLLPSAQPNGSLSLPSSTSADLPTTRALIKDATRLLHTFHQPIQTSSHHIHLSALPFTPPQTALHRIYTPRSHRLVSSSPSFRRVPNVVRGAPRSWDPCLWTLKGHHGRRVRSVCCSFDGRYVVTGCDDGCVRVFDADGFGGCGIVRVLEGHEGPVWNVGCGVEGRVVVSGGKDGTVRTWEVATG
ncbi:hypothetical protein HK101_005452, partial [Irineochytrium annulatum]